MLDLITGRVATPCDRIPRRDFLRVGGLGLGGMTLADTLRLKGLAEGPDARSLGLGPSFVKDKAVVLLFLAGGPSQYETFDPKPGGLDGFTSINGHIETAIPGVRFSAYLPKLAQLADRLTIVRSFRTNHAEHNGADKQLLTGDLTVGDGQPIKEPGVGAVFARVAGVMHPRTGMLRHALVPPTLNYPGAGKGFAGSFEAVVEGMAGAHLGAAYGPVELRAPMAGGISSGKKKKDGDAPNPFLDALEAKLTPDDILARRKLLAFLESRADRLTSPVADAIDVYREQAFEMLGSDQIRKAFDLSLEDPTTVKAYDTEHHRLWQCDDSSHFIRTEPSLGFSLGRQLLLARRLCEAGCGFITVISSNWDFHARKGIPNMPEGMGAFGPPLDHAVSAFLHDIRERGLEDKILLLITGEFGRSGLDKNAGRHHHPKICPLVMAGGGLRHGQVIGQSDHRGSQPATEPISIDDLQATILHTLLDIPQVRLEAHLPQKIQDRLSRGRPISELLGKT